MDVIQFAVRRSVVIPLRYRRRRLVHHPAGSLSPITNYPYDLAFASVAGATTGGTDIGPVLPRWQKTPT